MTDDETPRRSPRFWPLLALGALAACTVRLQSTGTPPAPEPAAPRRPAVKAGRPAAATPSPTVSPSPIPRLTHLDLPEDGTEPPQPSATVPPIDDTVFAPVPEPTVDAPMPASAPPIETAPPTAAFALAPASASGTATLERRGDLLIAAARLNGQPFGALLLDTGAGGTFLDRRLADERQLQEIISGSTEGARDQRATSIRELSGLSLGDVTLAADRAFVVDLHDGESVIGGPLAGVIGLPAFGNAPFTIDFTTGALTVYSDASFDPPASVAADALRIDQGLPFVEATLADNSTVWLLLDTGSPAAVTVWRGFAKQHPGIIRAVAAPAPAPTSDLYAPAGTPTPAAPRGSELRAFRVLGDRFDRIPVLVQDPAERSWQRARVVGRIGMALLRDLRITIHPVTERIWVERLRPPNAP